MTAKKKIDELMALAGGSADAGGQAEERHRATARVAGLPRPPRRPQASSAHGAVRGARTVVREASGGPLRAGVWHTPARAAMVRSTLWMERGIDVVLATKLDRLARSTRHLVASPLPRAVTGRRRSP